MFKSFKNLSFVLSVVLASNNVQAVVPGLAALRAGFIRAGSAVLAAPGMGYRCTKYGLVFAWDNKLSVTGSVALAALISHLAVEAVREFRAKKEDKKGLKTSALNVKGTKKTNVAKVALALALLLVAGPAKRAVCAIPGMIGFGAPAGAAGAGAAGAGA